MATHSTHSVRRDTFKWGLGSLLLVDVNYVALVGFLDNNGNAIRIFLADTPCLLLPLLQIVLLLEFAHNKSTDI